MMSWWNIDILPKLILEAGLICWSIFRIFELVIFLKFFCNLCKTQNSVLLNSLNKGLCNWLKNINNNIKDRCYGEMEVLPCPIWGDGVFGHVCLSVFHYIVEKRDNSIKDKLLILLRRIPCNFAEENSSILLGRPAFAICLAKSLEFLLFFSINSPSFFKCKDCRFWFFLSFTHI